MNTLQQHKTHTHFKNNNFLSLAKFIPQTKINYIHTSTTLHDQQNTLTTLHNQQHTSTTLFYQQHTSTTLHDEQHFFNN